MDSSNQCLSFGLISWVLQNWKLDTQNGSGHSCHLAIQGWSDNISNCWTLSSIVSLGLAVVSLKCKCSVASLASHEGIEESKELRFCRNKFEETIFPCSLSMEKATP